MKNTTKLVLEKAAGQDIDPAVLWMDAAVEPTELVSLDPLDITREMVEQAEHPEIADPVIAMLPERNFCLTTEMLRRKTWKEEARKRAASASPRQGEGQDDSGDLEFVRKANARLACV